MISLYLHYRGLQVSGFLSATPFLFSVSPLVGTFGPTECLGGPAGTSWLRIESLDLSWAHLEAALMECELQLVPLPSQEEEALPKLITLPFATSPFGLGQMVGNLPFPAKANSLSAALAPLSCARRRDKSQTCLLTVVSSAFPSSPGLITLRTELAEGQALSHKWIRSCRGSVGN